MAREVSPGTLAPQLRDTKRASKEGETRNLENMLVSTTWTLAQRQNCGFKAATGS